MTPLQNITFCDETFDSNSSSSYVLLLQFGEGSLGYCVFDTARSKFIALSHRAIDNTLPTNVLYDIVKDFIATEPVLTCTFKKSALLYIQHKYAIVPSVIFEKEKIKDYFAVSHMLEELDELHHNHLPVPDAHVVFSCSQDIAELFRSKIPSLTFVHQALPFINITARTSVAASDYIALFVYADYVDIVIVKSNKLQLCNAFPWDNENDILYAVLHCLEKCSLSLTVPCLLSGYITKESPAYVLLKTYIPTIVFGKPEAKYSFSYRLKSIPDQVFSNFYNSISCV